MATRRSRNKKGKLKKILLIVGVGLFALVIGLYVLSSIYLTKNYITEKVEESINCRMELGDVDLSLFSPTAKLKLKEIKLAQRDSFVDDGVAHDDRPALTDAEVSVSHVDVDVSLFSILFRTLDVSSLKIDGFKAKVVIQEDGSNNLEELFASPKKKKKDKEKSDRDKGKTFNVYTQQDFAASLRKFEFTNAELDVTIAASQLQLLATGLNISLVDVLHIDPANIKETALANVKFEVEADLQSSDGLQQYGEVTLLGGVHGTIFNSVSGDLDPNVDITIEISGDSHLKNVPAMSRISDEFVSMKLPKFLRKFLGDQVNQKIPRTYPLKKGTVFKTNFFRNVHTVKTPLSLEVGEWGLSLAENSYIDQASTEHKFAYTFTAGSTFSDYTGKGADLLKGLISKKVDLTGLEDSGKSWLQDGRVTLVFETTGEFTSPKVKMKTDFSTASKLGDEVKNKAEELEEEVKKGFRNLFK